MWMICLLKSLDNINEVRTLYHITIQLFTDSGFQLTKWATNAVDVYSEIPEEQRALAAKLVCGCEALNTQGAMAMKSHGSGIISFSDLELYENSNLPAGLPD